MRLIPVPESAEKKYPEAIKRIISPPDGDLFNEECRPADMLVDVVDFMGDQCRVYYGFYQLEPEDIDRLRENGGVIELSLVSAVIPFSLTTL